MRKLIVAVAALAFVTLCTHAPSAALAKGGTGIIIGGGDLAPYFYMIPKTPPHDAGWVGLLGAPDGGAPSEAHPSEDDAALLSSAYDLYFDYDIEGMAARSPSARYVPAARTRGAYLHFEQQGKALPYGWYSLPDDSSGYLFEAVQEALAAKSVRLALLQTDPIAAFVRNDLLYTDDERAPASGVASFALNTSARTDEGLSPLTEFAGDDADRLLDAYVATLHHWHPGYDYGRPLYTISGPGGGEVFAYEPAGDGLPAHVYAAQGFGGYFDPDPALAPLLGLQTTSPTPPIADAHAPHSASRSNNVAAAIVAIALFSGLAVVAGAARLLSHRSDS